MSKRIIWGFWAMTVAAAFFVGRAQADGAIPEFAYLRDSAGEIYVVTNGLRVGLPIYPATDEQIGALPFTGLYMLPKTTENGPNVGPRPEWAVSPNAAAQSQQPAPSGWSAIAQWSGRSDKMSEPVSIGARVWRISYTVRDAKYGNPQICIQATRLSDGRLVSSGCYHEADSTYVYAGPGSYAFRISSGDEWTVAVEEQR